MPNYKTHRNIGFVASIIISFFIIAFFNTSIQLTKLQWILLPFVILFYTNLPDIDHHIGKLRKRTLTLIFSVMVLSSIIIYFVNLGIMVVLLSIVGLLGLGLLRVKHRGPMHTYPFVLIVSLPLLYIHWFLFIIAFSVSAGHIFVDRLYSKVKRKIKTKFNLYGNEPFKSNNASKPPKIEGRRGVVDLEEKKPGEFSKAL